MVDMKEEKENIKNMEQAESLMLTEYVVDIKMVKYVTRVTVCLDMIVVNVEKVETNKWWRKGLVDNSITGDMMIFL